jgi:hypothetical protein
LSFEASEAALISGGDCPEMGSPILVIPPALVAIAFVAFGVATLDLCDGNVALVWFGLAAFAVAGSAALFTSFRFAGVAFVVGLLCVATGLLSHPAGCTFMFQI